MCALHVAERRSECLLVQSARKFSNALTTHRCKKVHFRCNLYCIDKCSFLAYSCTSPVDCNFARLSIRQRLRITTQTSLHGWILTIKKRFTLRHTVVTPSSITTQRTQLSPVHGSGTSWLSKAIYSSVVDWSPVQLLSVQCPRMPSLLWNLSDAH